MNKDVLYIAPEDDITDVVSKIENSAHKIIAIIPPSDAEIFHSIINMKLIHKTATSAGKAAVIVTADDSIIKLAASLKIPVTKDLKTAPAIPINVTTASDTPQFNNALAEADEPEDKLSSSDLFDQFSKEKTVEKTTISESKTESQPTSQPTNHTPFVKWIIAHKKTTIFGIIAIILIILFFLWATIIAPAASIKVSVRTTSANFSENVSFTTKTAEEDTTAGKFYLEEKKLETPEKIEFTATGSKNIGEKAAGTLQVSIFFGYIGQSPSGIFKIPSGTIFTYDNLNYVADSDTIYSVTSDEDCSNYNSGQSISEAKKTLCIVTKEFSISAESVGEKYNIPGTKQDWTSALSNIYSISNTAAISGGADKIITVVSEEDVEKAKESLTSTTDTDAKKAILETLSEGSLAINSSFKKITSDLEISPAIGEEVKDGVKPYISTTTTSTIYYVDSTRIEEFIRTTAKLSSDQKVYSIGEPFIENFNSDSNSGKLKTTYTYGPQITAEQILEKVKGRKIGEVQALLKSINGIDTVTITPSFFWVNSVPDDANKITIDINIPSKD